MIEIATFKEMVEKLNIYEPIKIQLVKAIDGKIYIDKPNYEVAFKILHPENNRVITKCIDCNHEHSFFVSEEMFSFGNSSSSDSNSTDFDFAKTLYSYFDLREKKNIQQKVAIESLYESDGYINYVLKCSNNYKHVQTILLRIIIRKGTLTIIKVGQDPINIDLTDDEAKKYEKQLKRFDAVDDLKNALRSKNRNLYAGAATYLRRIFEKIVNYYLEEKRIDSTGKRMKEKLEEIKECLDPDFYEYSNNIHSLLSKGIHELSEDEIMKMFGTLFGAILFQLDFEKRNDDAKAKKEEIGKTINELMQKNS